MKAAFFRIATAKSGAPEARDALEAIGRLAADFEHADATFPDRVRESKQRRGAGAPKLDKARREQLASLDADRIALDDDLARQFEALPSAQAIVRALHGAMGADLPNARKLLKHYHPDELPLGEDMVSRKEALVAAMSDFLNRFPEDG